MYAFDEIKSYDGEIAEAIELELGRQRQNIELIASENFVSKAVMAAMGSPLTNKYAEGYPGKRYYGGCQYVDMVENLAIERAKKLFGAEYVNVQPHSGAQANMAVFQAFLKPGDTFMGMNLDHGGHLTHGSPANYSGKVFKCVPYGVNDDGFIDYDEVRSIALECRPKLIVAGASAYCRQIDFKRFRAIADEVDAILMVDMAHIAGLVAAGLHPSPIPYAHVTTTTTHKTLRGPRGGMILSSEEFGKKLNSAIFPGTQGGPLMHVIAAKAVAFKEALSDEPRGGMILSSEEFGKKLNSAIFPGTQGGPLMHVIAAKAVAFKEALSDDFKAYQQKILDNAKALAGGLEKRGINIVSKGTDNHLMLLDLRNLGLTGKEAEKMLDEVHITCNKNTIPNDPQSPFVTSGLRLGTPAATTRGLDTADMDMVAEAIAFALKDFENNKEKAAAIVKTLTDKYPLY